MRDTIQGVLFDREPRGTLRNLGVRTVTCTHHRVPQRWRALQCPRGRRAHVRLHRRRHVSRPGGVGIHGDVGEEHDHQKLEEGRAESAAARLERGEGEESVGGVRDSNRERL